MVVRHMEPVPCAGNAPPGGTTMPNALSKHMADKPSGRPGTLSTRFVRDLFEGSFLNEPTSLAKLPVHEGVSHEFCATVDPTYEQAALYCKRCRLHFFIHSENNLPPPPGDHSHVPCGTPSIAKQYPAHHLVEDEILIGFENCQPATIHYHVKYHPVAVIARFLCSNSGCAFNISIEISPPRLTSHLTDSFVNQAGLDARKEEAIASNLTKAQNAENLATPATAYRTAIRVLHDLIHCPFYNGSLRKFDVRTNATFRIIFGGENVEFLRYLELDFSRAEPEDGDESELAVWRFPPPPSDSDELLIDGRTKRLVGTRKTFYLECLVELYSIVGTEPANMKGVPGAGVQSTIRTIVMGLGPVVKRQAATDNDHDKHPAYKTLGVLRADSTNMVMYAFDRQVSICPEMRARFAEALVEVSLLRDDPELQIRAVQERSFAEQSAQNDKIMDDAADDALAAVEEAAYKYLLVGGGDVSDARKYPDISIIGLAKNRLEACPSDTGTLEKLEVIANARDSEEIRNFIDVMKVEAAGGPMAPTDAYALLDLSYKDMGPGSKIDKEILISVARANASESAKDKKQLAQALRVLASQLDNDPSLLSDANNFDPQSGFEVIGGQLESTAITTTTATAPMAGSHTDIPVGLYNIGNTCYLNSILQYLYTLKPVRNLLAEFDQHKLDLSPGSIAIRRIGGNKTRLERAEAIAAQQFVQELASLFENLHKCPRTYVRPKQRLANAALLSVPQLLANAKRERAQQPATTSPIPPQLPPRPLAPDPQALPSPPLSDDVEMSNAGHEIIVSPTGVNDQETASHSSTQTLVNMEGSSSAPASTSLISDYRPKISVVAVEPSPSEAEPDADVQMNDSGTGETHAGSGLSRPVTPSTAKPDNVEPEVENLIRKALDNSDRSGTAQQDVEEVMGNIMLRMQEAITSTGEGTLDGKTQIQLDQIMESFYCVLVNLTAKEEGDGTLEEIAHERWITAYPDEKASVSMYEALDRTFDKQFLDGTQRPRYSVIRHLPPILHICIQRSAANGQKNLNKVDIPHTLYLDRYMEDVDDSGLSDLRDRAWEIKLRLGQLRSQTTDDNSANPSTRGVDAVESTMQAEANLDLALFGRPLPTSNITTNEGVNPSDLDAKMNVEVSTLDSETAMLNPNEPPTPPEPDMSPADEVEKRETELAQLWAGRHNYEYNLHAIICHSGAGSGFGHYWVFVYDFERQVWYRYNDETVTKHTDGECMSMIQSKGNPYYVAYIRGGSHIELVDIPERSPEPDSAEHVDDDDEIMPALASADGPVVYGPQPRPSTKIGWTTYTPGRINALNGSPHPGEREVSVEVEMGGMSGNAGEGEQLPTYDQSVQSGGVNADPLGDCYAPIRPRAPSPSPRGRPLSSNPTLAGQFSRSNRRSPSPNRHKDGDTSRLPRKSRALDRGG